MFRFPHFSQEPFVNQSYMCQLWSIHFGGYRDFHPRLCTILPDSPVAPDIPDTKVISHSVFFFPFDLLASKDHLKYNNKKIQAVWEEENGS